MRAVLALLFGYLLSLESFEGKMVNPITDVCWECLFPITFGGINVTPGHEDLTHSHPPICTCAGTPPKIGIPLTFWEPLKMIEVTRHAYKLIGLGGLSFGTETIKNRGCVGIIADGPSQSSFYHCHVYNYPIFAILEILTDFACIEPGNLDLAYFSELDPFWTDESWSLLQNPEAGFFANPLAQLSCVADCAAASVNRPLDKLFWCAGCEGSLYPFTGTVPHHIGGCQASALLTHRVIAKMHRSYLMKGYEEEEFCESKYMPLIKKSLYKTQLVHPIPQTHGSCHPLGKTDLLWGMGKAYPYSGEDFIYFLWVKKQCCLDATKAAQGKAL